MKLLYFHVPKTAGSSINKFFGTYIDKSIFHIESQKELSKVFCEKYDFISGHVSYTKMNKILDLKEWITVATFRDPLAYTISHLKWVRKLADEGEESRLHAHTQIIQDIALKMREFDFSLSSDIECFIKWLEEIGVFYFHNTQTSYMHEVANTKTMTDFHLKKALEHLNNIDYIGIQEDLDSFMEMMSYEFGWTLEDKPKVNMNENNYGFDINNSEIQKALFPLYEKDLILYEEAKKLFKAQKQFYRNEPSNDIIGFIDKIDQAQIIGWVRSKDSLKKVKLELRVNGNLMEITQTNHFRQGIKIKRIHPSGICEFRFDLRSLNLKETDNLVISVKDSGKILKRSS